jgi:hypothetical protein
VVGTPIAIGATPLLVGKTTGGSGRELGSKTVGAAGIGGTATAVGFATVGLMATGGAGKLGTVAGLSGTVGGSVAASELDGAGIGAGAEGDTCCSDTLYWIAYDPVNVAPSKKESAVSNLRFEMYEASFSLDSAPSRGSAPEAAVSAAFRLRSG